MNNPKVIAFYLPQYHPTPDNDKWWGKGFTEWTNVGKAKPLFRGHYQPKVPADLGYYDLRLPEVREAQAALAKEAGIYGFCYYHYWFGNGKEELELPFNEVLRLGKPDFPFMLCWANESWHKKFWDKDGKGSSKEVLIEQTYPGEKDIIDHFYRLLPAFKDPRYIRIDGKIAFMVYKPFDIPEIKQFMEIWNNLAKENNLKGFHFIAHCNIKIEKKDIENLKNLGYSAINKLNMWYNTNPIKSKLSKSFRKIYNNIFHKPFIHKFDDLVEYMYDLNDTRDDVYPSIVPNWDHTPRSGINGSVFIGSTPTKFESQIKKILNLRKANRENIMFLKSWNEWGEGNYVEPDLRYGHQYLDAIRKGLLNENYE